MKNGLIFDIQRFCTTDGPGIRTVVFFKGCNLRCFWCHNPESLSCRPELEFFVNKCIGCGLCASVCPAGAHQVKDGSHTLDRSLCKTCLSCTNVCPMGALRTAGREYTLEECFREIAEDTPFYRNSGGGVTLSGGEVLMQSEFAAALLKRCREAGIHCAIETNLSLPWSRVEALLPYLDLVMMDVKHADSDAHRRGTGQRLETVWANLEKLKATGIPIIVRTPVIPGFNKDPETIAAIARRLKQIPNLQYYELLTYNALGCEKAGRLGREQPRLTASAADTRALANIAAAAGIPVLADGKRMEEPTNA